MEYFTSEPHEFITSSGAWCEKLSSNQLLEQTYQEDARIFRAKFFQTLDGLNAIDAGQGWAYYLQRSEGEDGKSKYIETVLRSDVYSNNNNEVLNVPVIRIVVNESAVVGKTLQWLSYDFMLDDAGDAQYYVDVVNQQVQNLSDTQAALIIMSEDGELKINNLKSYTPIAIIDEDNNEARTVLPFGHCSSVSDRIDALEVGSLFLNNVAEIDPRFIIDINAEDE